MKFILPLSRSALLLALMMPVATAAEKPNTQPQPDRQQMRADGFPKRPGAGKMLEPKPTQEEIESATEFAKTNFPSFFEVYSRTPPNGPARFNMTQRLVGRYRNMMRMQEQDPELYDTMLGQAKLEDEAVGLAREMRNARNDGARADAEVKLRKVVTQIVEKSLSERKRRIEKLRAALEEQERRLKDDQENKDQLIVQQYNRTQQEGEPMFRGNPRGPGPGPDGTGSKNALQR